MKLPERRLQRVLESQMGEADRKALRRFRPRAALAGAIKESLRSGTRGVIREYRIFGEPWGFELSHIRIEVGVWQGDDDNLVRPSDSRLLARRIPRSRLVIAPGEGHVSVLRNHAEEILSWVTGGREGRAG